MPQSKQAPATPDEIADRGVLDEQTATPLLSGEPAAIIGVLVAVLVAVQQLALPLPDLVNAAISLVLVVAGALGIRSQVTPVHE